MKIKRIEEQQLLTVLGIMCERLEDIGEIIANIKIPEPRIITAPEQRMNASTTRYGGVQIRAHVDKGPITTRFGETYLIRNDSTQQIAWVKPENIKNANAQTLDDLVRDPAKVKWKNDERRTE